ADGDQKAGALFYARHAKAVADAARKLCRTRRDADDVCQDVFLQVLTKAEKIAGFPNLRVWLLSRVYYAVLDLRRDGAKRGRYEGRAGAERDHLDAISEQEIFKELQDATVLREVLGRLDEPQRREME